MDTVVRRHITVVLALLFMFLPALGILGTALTRPLMVDRAEAWVADLSDRDLEAVAVRLDHLPVAYRRAVLGRLGPSRSAPVWEKHILTYLALHPDLSERQVAFLNDVATLLHDGLLSSPQPDLRSKLDKLAATSAELLPPTVGRLLFVDLGPADSDPSVKEPVLGRISGWVASQLGAVSAASGGCECSRQSDWCGPFAACIDPLNTCEVTSSGCGTFLLYPCDGLCWEWTR